MGLHWDSPLFCFCYGMRIKLKSDSWSIKMRKDKNCLNRVTVVVSTFDWFIKRLYHCCCPLFEDLLKLVKVKRHIYSKCFSIDPLTRDALSISLLKFAGGAVLLSTCCVLLNSLPHLLVSLLPFFLSCLWSHHMDWIPFSDIEILLLIKIFNCTRVVDILIAILVLRITQRDYSFHNPVWGISNFNFKMEWPLYIRLTTLVCCKLC